MMTTIQKFKALLKAKNDNDIDKLLEKCTLDEMKKFASVLKIDEKYESKTLYQVDIYVALIKRMIYKRTEWEIRTGKLNIEF